MTRKDFKAMAATLMNIGDLQARRLAAVCFAEVARKANPRFDVNRFFDACGV